MLNTELIAEISEKVAEHRRLQDKADRLKVEIDKLKEPLLENMIDSEVNEVKLGDATAKIQSQVWAKQLKGKEATMEALKKAGFDDFLAESFNANRLSAFVRECENEGRPLPESFNGVIEAVTKINLKVS